MVPTAFLTHCTNFAIDFSSTHRDRSPQSPSGMHAPPGRHLFSAHPSRELPRTWLSARRVPASKVVCVRTVPVGSHLLRQLIRLAARAVDQSVGFVVVDELLLVGIPLELAAEPAGDIDQMADG